MALPQLTDEQRAAALEKAAAARRIRAELKDRLKRGGTNLTQVLKDAETDEVLGKMKVSALLEALPKVGKVKAQEIMTVGGVLPADLDGKIESGALEGSNVNMTQALVDMIENQRSYEVQANLMKSAKDMDESSASLMRLPS